MRLKEFTKIKEAPIGTTTAIGGALATGVGRLTGLTIDYIQKFFSWKGTRDAKKKAKKEKELHKSAAKMNPKEKDVAKNVVSNPQSQEYKDAEAKWKASQKSTSKRKPGRSRALNPTRDWKKYYKDNP